MKKRKKIKGKAGGGSVGVTGNGYVGCRYDIGGVATFMGHPSWEEGGHCHRSHLIVIVTVL